MNDQVLHPRFIKKKKKKKKGKRKINFFQRGILVTCVLLREAWGYITGPAVKASQFLGICCCHVDVSSLDGLQLRNVTFTGCQLQQPPN
jgi:hypothetical protein